MTGEGRLQRAPGAPALVVAHRGAWGPEPQNSLAAFRRAIAVGADAVELDVRRTADGRLIVVHDARLGLRAVSRLELGAVRARMRGGQAPELEPALAALAGRIGVDVELKEDGYVDEAMAVLAGTLPAGDYVVTSFLDAVLAQARAAVPGVRTGLLLGSRHRLDRLDRRIHDTGADFVAPHVSLLRATDLLQRCAARRILVWPWTVNDPGLSRRLLHDGRVEALITDDAPQAVSLAAAGPRPGTGVGTSPPSAPHSARGSSS